MRQTVLLILPILLSACGGAAAVSEPAVAVAARAPEAPLPVEAPAPRARENIQGLTGSLSTAAVRRTVEPRLAEFAACFATHGRGLRTLGGRIELKFEIAQSGQVRDVHAVDSTVGHRAVERCVVEVAEDLRFPRPQGGIAHATWPLELDPPDHVRHPVTWDPDRVEGVVNRRAPRMMRRCQVDGTFQVTTYVARNGRVLAAGAVAQDPVDTQQLDCVARAVRGWRMPAHRERQAKVTFNLPG